MAPARATSQLRCTGWEDFLSDSVSDPVLPGLGGGGRKILGSESSHLPHSQSVSMPRLYTSISLPQLPTCDSNSKPPVHREKWISLQVCKAGEADVPHAVLQSFCEISAFQSQVCKILISSQRADALSRLEPLSPSSVSVGERARKYWKFWEQVDWCISSTQCIIVEL